MTKREDVVLVTLGLGSMAAEEGETFAAEFYTRVLRGVANSEVRRMADRLTLIDGIGPKSAIELLAQLGWFLSAQLVDNGTAPVLY